MPHADPGDAQHGGPRPDVPNELLKVLDSDAARVRRAVFRRLRASAAPVDVPTLALDTHLDSRPSRVQPRRPCR